jgi:hypothetical protein
MGKLIEVDEEQYNSGQVLKQKLGQIFANPDAKKLLQKAHKMVDPKAITPELDADEKMTASESALRKEFEDYKAAQEKKESEALEASQKTQGEARWNAGRDALRQRGFTEDGIKAIEELMAKEGITNHKIAADSWERDNPPAMPAMPGGTGGWNFLDQSASDSDEDIKKLISTRGDNDSLVEKMALQTLAEMRQSQRR